MKKVRSISLLAIISLLLSGCYAPTDKEMGQTVLVIAPAVFIASLVVQHGFFQLWKRNYSQLSLSWLPNFIFLIFLVVIAILFGNGSPFCFFGDLWFSEVLILWGTSVLTVLILFTRVWLFFKQLKIFTWASILVISFFILPAFPMIAGLTNGTVWSRYIDIFWKVPGGAGIFFVLILFVLLIEVQIKTRKKAGNNE